MGWPSGCGCSAAYYLVSESLTNVAKHSHASSATVEVTQVKGALVVEVVDDGKGVPRRAMRAPHSLGILGMRERARAWGGELTVRRQRRGGTRVRARLPLDAPVPAEQETEVAIERTAETEIPS